MSPKQRKISLGMKINLKKRLPIPYQGSKPLTDKMIRQWKRKGMA